MWLFVFFYTLKVLSIIYYNHILADKVYSFHFTRYKLQQYLSIIVNATGKREACMRTGESAQDDVLIVNL